MKIQGWHDCHGYLARYETDKEGRTITVFQHRKVMEEHIGRPLDKNEVVHHKNGYRSDNRVENLALLSYSGHMKEHRKIEFVTVSCLQCGKVFKKEAREERARIKKKRSGPFCGKSCTGKWSKQFQDQQRKDIGYIAVIQEALRRGESLRSLAKKLGVDHSTLSYHKRKMNQIRR